MITISFVVESLATVVASTVELTELLDVDGPFRLFMDNLHQSGCTNINYIIAVFE